MSWKTHRVDPPVLVPIPLPSPQHRLDTALWSCPPGLQVSGRGDYPQVLDTRQIWVLSSVSVGRPSKPRYRIGARQLAQLAFGKPPGASHGTSFALMAPDKPPDQSCLPSRGVKLVSGWTGKQRYSFWRKQRHVHVPTQITDTESNAKHKQMV